MNRSSAVMQQRHEPHDSLDFFPTPPWATRALCERIGVLSNIDQMKVWEPACGQLDMAIPLSEYFKEVYATDVHNYDDDFSGQDDVLDFLSFSHAPNYDWIITNPPFRLAEQFVTQAVSSAKFGAAVFVRTSFLEGKRRYESLFKPTPPALVLQFVERVPLVKGRLDRGASSATSYCWIVWLKNFDEATKFEWIAPCRQRLERGGDYPVKLKEMVEAPLFEAQP